MGFLTNATNYTIEEIIAVSNVTDPIQFLQNANNFIYNGMFYFIIMWVLWVLLFIAGQKLKDDAPLVNAMFGGAICSIAAIILRVMQLMSDHQMWIFPIVTSIIAVIVWSTKDN